MKPVPWILAVLVLAPSLARAQSVDVLVEAVQASPAEPRVDDPVTVRATVRRQTPGKAQPLKAPVDVEVELSVVGEGKPFATRKLTLGLDQAAKIEATWKAQVGQHAFRVRVSRIMLKGQLLQDAGPANDMALGPAIQVRSLATQSAPRALPPLPPAVGLPESVANPKPSLGGAPIAGSIAGVLSVPRDLRAQYRVAIEGPGGLRRTADASGTGDSRRYRFDDLLPGDYRLTPEGLASGSATPTPTDGWSPRQRSVMLRGGERLEGARGVDFTFRVGDLLAGGRLGTGVPTPPLPATPAGSRQAIDAPIWLRVNGGPSAEAEPGRPVDLSWDLPPDNRFEFVNLAATVRAERDGAATPAGPRCFLARYCYDESASPGQGLTANGFAQAPGTSPPTFMRPNVAGAPRGSLRLDLAAPAFPFRLVYAFRVLYTNTASELKTSNEVYVTWRAVSPEPVVPPPGSGDQPDLRVTRLDYVRTGADARKVTAIVAAEAGRTGRITGRVPYEITADGGAVPVERGEVEITRLGVGGIMSAYRIPSGGAHLVRLVVNGSRRVTEVRYDNNAAEAYLGEPDDQTRIPLQVHDAWKMAEGYTWVRLGVRFSGHALNDAARLEVTVPDGAIDCTSGDAGLAPGRVGPSSFVNRVASFLCVPRSTGRLVGSQTTRSVLVFEGSGVDTALRWSFPVEKTWRWDYQTVDRAPELPDLDLQVLAVQVGPRSSGILQGVPWYDLEGSHSTWAYAGPVAVKVTNLGQHASGPYEVSARIGSALSGAPGYVASSWKRAWGGSESGRGLAPNESAYHCFHPGELDVMVFHQFWTSMHLGRRPEVVPERDGRSEVAAQLRASDVEFGRAQKAFTAAFPEPRETRSVTTRLATSPEDQAAANGCTYGGTGGGGGLRGSGLGG